MVHELPEELLAQATFLLTLPPNQANVRRAVSTAYYAVFHLLIRETVRKWGEPLQQARIARIFEHDRMKKVSGSTIPIMKAEAPDSSANETSVRGELAKVAQEFVFLQQARHDADYNLEKPLDLAAAMQIVDRAHSAFASWNAAAGSPVANEYLFSLLFKERERV